MEEPWHFVIFAREEYASALSAVLPTPHLRVHSSAEFASAVAKRRLTIAFVDVALLDQIERTSGVTIVGITSGGVTELVNALIAMPGLFQLISVSMLTGPSAAAKVAQLCNQIKCGPELPVLGEDGVGRAALLASSERRAIRLERVAEFFAAQSVHHKTIAMVSDVAEELITNALYDAPHEAGWFDTPVARTSAVELPPEHACEISYGIERDNLFVRVRDPFGALTHERLLQVLDRCRRKNVQFDESRGGAGLGMWRVFSAASTLVVSVIPGRLTDILVWIDASNRRPTGRLQTVVLRFPDRFDLDGVAGRFAADHDFDLMDDSFTALIS